jgi:hypothetical protein
MLSVTCMPHVPSVVMLIVVMLRVVVCSPPHNYCLADRTVFLGKLKTFLGKLMANLKNKVASLLDSFAY